MNVKNLIIGAGPCGLGAGYTFTKKGEQDFLIVEKEDKVGGLSRSFRTDENFLFEIGGHVHFSNEAEYLNAISEVYKKENLFFHDRKAYIYLDQSFIDYPFQNNLDQLPKNYKLTKHQEENRDIKNFEDWLLNKFGEDVCNIFMHPYNRKVWSHSLEDMAYNWTEERISPLTKVDNWGPNNSFFFPKKDGTGDLWRSFAEFISFSKIKLNTTITSIDFDKKIATTSKGESIYYQYLLNTSPLTSFLKNTNCDVSTNSLKHNSLICTGLGVKGPIPKSLLSKCWIYFPQDAPFYRMTILSNYSNDNIPSQEYYSLLLERTFPSEEKVDSTENLNDTINYLIEKGFIESQELITSKWNFISPFAYPIPTLGRDRDLKIINEYLKSKSIESLGRFGSWKYELGNQDHCFMQGLRWAENV